MTRRQKRRRFFHWLSQLFTQPSRAIRQRRVQVESLENRQLLAADGFAGLLGSDFENLDANAGSPVVGAPVAGAPVIGTPITPAGNPTTNSNLTGEGEGGLVGEGEDTTDLVAFAQALTDSGTRFFGASWCQFCTDQKELFEDGGKYLPFIEVTNPDRTPNQIATDEGITEYPTWEFPDGSRLTGLQSLDTLASRAGITVPMSSTPSMDDLQDVNVEIGSPLHIPIDAYDPNGDPLTITVTSDDASLITAEVLTGNRSLTLSTAGFGDMTFELFEGRAPVPSGRVIQLAQDGFYDGVTFHRVINNFVIQGGDPTGTGGGGSTLGDFDDQFHVDLQHNQTGVLSYAKSTDDTNDSQFFITEGQQRFLDFNHSVFGQLVEGEEVREAISNTSTSASDRPTNSVVIESATVFDDTENGIIVLRATGNGTGSSTITVTVTDSESRSTSQTFEAIVAQDSANGAPFLNPVDPVQTNINTPVQVNLTSQDAEDDTVVYSVTPISTENFGLSLDSAQGIVTVTPPTDFVGELQFRATVQQTTSPTTSSPDDNQIITVQVNQGAPTAIDLADASDSGSSSTDNITNAQSLTFTVSGTTVGALVELRAGGNVVGSATANGTTTDIDVTNVVGLGEGDILFTATQTINSETSSESPALTVTLDSTGPTVLGSDAIPTSITAGSQLNVDLQHGEEGNGLVYSLNNPPVGMTINGSTGVLDWTPTESQAGIQSVNLILTDAAGNTTNQTFSITVAEQPDVRISLNVVDLQGQPISTVAPNEEFRVQVLINDLRTPLDASGVFAAYADLEYDSAVIEPVSVDPISYVAPYTNGQSGDTSTLGIIDELGAFSSDSSRQGPDQRVLVEVTFRAKTTGNANLSLNAAEDAGSEVLLYDQSAAVPSSRVEYGTSSFAVGADFTLVDDSFNFDEDSSAQTLDVFANDQLNGTVNIVSVSTPTGGGQVTIASGGQELQYTPAADFNGEETFVYTAENTGGVQSTATVTIQVTDINDDPVALNDTFSVNRGSSNNELDVLSNDNSGVDSSSSETLTITDVSGGSAGGAITVGNSGLIINYTPGSNFEGTETFTYTVSDGRGGSTQGTVSVSVNSDNPAPVPTNDEFTVVEDAASATFDVLANDTTEPDETLTIIAVSSSQQGGQVSVSSDNLTIEYQPGANFTGQEILTYTIRDSGGAEASGLVTFNVTEVNDAPEAQDDTFTALSGDATTTLTVLANDTTTDANETLTITAVSAAPANSGTLAIASDSQSIIYTPPSDDFEGSFSFTYTIDDGNGLTDTATVTLTVEDFQLRDFDGFLTYSSGNVGGTPTSLAGMRLLLEGTDSSGNPVSETTLVNADGSYSFAGQVPGIYTLSRPAIPFLFDEGASITINSGNSDGNASNNLDVSGAFRPQFIGIRDFLGSSLTSSLTVVVDADGAQNWAAPQGDWENLSSISSTLNTTANTLSISAVDSSSNNLQSPALEVGGPGSVVYEAGRSSTFRLLRIHGTPTDAGLTIQSSGGASGEGEASGLIAEGEAADSLSELATPIISGVRSSAASETPLTPENALQRMLGSNFVAPMSEEAVDAAMEDVLPSLEVQLSDSLQSTLANDQSSSDPLEDQVSTEI